MRKLIVCLLTFMVVFFCCCSKKQKQDLTKTKFRITVNYDQPLQEAITSGNFSKVDQRIDSINFPPKHHIRLTKKQKIICRLVLSNPEIWLSQLVGRMEKHGYYPANLEEALAFAQAYPKLKVDGSIVILESAFQIPHDPFIENFSHTDFWYVPCLSLREERSLELTTSSYCVRFGKETYFLFTNQK